jgi:hypothetical protein
MLSFRRDSLMRLMLFTTGFLIALCLQLLCMAEHLSSLAMATVDVVVDAVISDRRKRSWQNI